MQIFENLPPIVGLILGFVLLVWLVFVFLVPFMIESIRQSARKTHEELVELNRKLDALGSRLADSARVSASAGLRENPPPGPPGQPAARSDAGKPEGRRRREPTISETDFQNQPRPNRREPRVK